VTFASTSLWCCLDPSPILERTANTGKDPNELRKQFYARSGQITPQLTRELTPKPFLESPSSRSRVSDKASRASLSAPLEAPRSRGETGTGSEPARCLSPFRRGALTRAQTGEVPPGRTGCTREREGAKGPRTSKQSTRSHSVLRRHSSGYADLRITGRTGYSPAVTQGERRRRR
jgi:hypothetical protein